MLRLTANAKINWTLNVLGRREDGYHLLDMLLQSVTLSDTLCMETAKELTLEGSMLADTEQDLTMRAARLLQQESGHLGGARMKLGKRIPSGAGMGGGSADAAAALIGLNELWALHYPMDKLLQLGLRLGADVPFMLTGGLCRVGGIGEKLDRLSDPKPLWLVAIQPCAGLSTKDVYMACDSAPIAKEHQPDNDACVAALRSGDVQALTRAMGNALEPVAVAMRPEIALAIQALMQSGAGRAMMTGSGSAVYGVFMDEESARIARQGLCKRYEKVYCMQTSDIGVAIEKL